MSQYQPGIPTGTVNLDVDYLNIQNNFTQLDTTFGVDHVTYSNQTAQNGYHTSIHFNPVSTTATNPPNNQPVDAPAAVPGYGQLFSAEINDGIATDTALYFLSGGGRLTQLNANIQPTLNTIMIFGTPFTVGYTYLPGGLIMQFGAVANNNPGGGSTSITTTFSTNNLEFPTSCFGLWVQALGTNGQLADAYRLTALSKTLFTVRSFDSITSTPLFYWWAIGN